MGVKGLLPCLQSITRAVPLERYRGLAAAVDAMSWLHKGIFACNVKTLAKSQRSNSTSTSSEELNCVNYAIKKAETLQQKFGLEILLVIDGDSLPSKKEENEQRRAERDKAFEKAVAAENAGDNRAARRFYAQSCSITYSIRYELIKACKEASISFLVAPYEADAQMARLSHTNMVDLVITEDSDILAYGCPRALFKIDFDTSQGQEIQLMKDIGENDTLPFKNWTHDMFVFMCIISGCDYCNGVPGIGIKLAHKIVRAHRTPAKIFNALRVAGRMPPDFEEKFWIAFRTFRHQRVFCLSKGLIEPLWPISGSKHSSNENNLWPFLGNHIENHMAREVAEGLLHPSKKIPWSEVNEAVVGNDSIVARTPSKSHIRHRTVSPQMKRTTPREPQSPFGKENASNEILEKKQMKEVFSFFSRSSKRTNEDSLQNNQPPLREIYLVGNDGKGSKSERKQRPLPPRNHIDVPIHFHEYNSRLVGVSFKPLSRKRTKTDVVGTKSSKFVQSILQKSPEIQGSGISENTHLGYDNDQMDSSTSHGRNQVTEGEYDNYRTPEYEGNHGFDKFRRQTVPPRDNSSKSSYCIQDSFQVVESRNVDVLPFSLGPGLLNQDDNFLYLEAADSQRRCSFDLNQSQHEQYQPSGSFVKEHHPDSKFSLSTQNAECFDTNFEWNDDTESENHSFYCRSQDDCGGSTIDHGIRVDHDLGSFQHLLNEEHDRSGDLDDYFVKIQSTCQSLGNEFGISTNNNHRCKQVSEGIFDDDLLNTFDSLEKL
ncbi:hypothetical protein ACHAXS_007063 [Conticribra weissflogii]